MSNAENRYGRLEKQIVSGGDPLTPFAKGARPSWDDSDRCARRANPRLCAPLAFPSYGLKLSQDTANVAAAADACSRATRHQSPYICGLGVPASGLGAAGFCVAGFFATGLVAAGEGAGEMIVAVLM